MKSVDAKTALDAAVSDYGQAKYDEGMADAQLKTTDGTIVYTEEQVAAKEKAAYDKGYAQAQADDKTPVTQEEYDAAKAEVSQLHADLDKALIEGKMNAEFVEKVKSWLKTPEAPTAPVVETPVVEAPAEGQAETQG